MTVAGSGMSQNEGMTCIGQKALAAHFRTMAAVAGQAVRFRDIGFGEFSEFDEDGILLYLFSILPPQSYKCVEMSAGNGRQCNTANLIINHHWLGLLFDADKKNVEDGIKFFGSHHQTRVWPPIFKQAWITLDNVNRLFESYGMTGQVDLFSIDLDGNDYWIWKHLTIASPMVVVAEVNPCIPIDQALTVPYNPQFKIDSTRNYFGASLAAFVKLAQAKNYRLVGTNYLGTNAFFVRNDLEHPWLPPVDPASCLQHPKCVHARTHRWPVIKHKPWEEA